MANKCGGKCRGHSYTESKGGNTEPSPEAAERRLFSSGLWDVSMLVFSSEGIRAVLAKNAWCFTCKEFLFCFDFFNQKKEILKK